MIFKIKVLSLQINGIKITKMLKNEIKMKLKIKK